MAISPNDELIDNIKNTHLGLSDIHGTGLFASQSFPKGYKLGTLTGTRMPWEMYRQMGYEQFVDKEWNALPNDWLLVRLQKTKYCAINHSRNPNAELRVTMKNGKHQVEIFVIKPIAAQEEILLDYRNEPLPEEYINSHGWAYL